MNDLPLAKASLALEDPRLLKRGGRYMDDLNIPIMAHRYILRSPHAHDLIRGIDTSAAETTPRVFAVLTGADCAIDGLDPVSCDMFLKRPNGGAY